MKTYKHKVVFTTSKGSFEVIDQDICTSNSLRFIRKECQAIATAFNKGEIVNVIKTTNL